MKTNKTEDQIVSLIKLRQLELATESLKIATKPFPKSTRKAMERVGLILGLTFRVAQLQRAINIIRLKPQPEAVKGAIIPKLDYETLITATGKEIKVPISEMPKCTHNPYTKVKGYACGGKIEKPFIKNPLDKP
jgi:hypothetical protein